MKINVKVSIYKKEIKNKTKNKKPSIVINRKCDEIQCFG